MALPDGLRLSPGGMAMAPDGESIVFVAAPPSAGGEPAGGSPAPRLYLRRLESMEVREIPGTEGARTPFFSPDGQTVGYLTNTALMKVSLQAGAPVHIGGVPPVSRGAVWLPDGSIRGPDTHFRGWYVCRPKGSRSRRRTWTRRPARGRILAAAASRRRGSPLHHPSRHGREP